MSIKDWHGDGGNTTVTAVFAKVMGAIIAVVLQEWGQMPLEYRGGGIIVCGIPAVLGTGNNYSISKQS